MGKNPLDASDDGNDANLVEEIEVVDGVLAINAGGLGGDLGATSGHRLVESRPVFEIFPTANGSMLVDGNVIAGAAVGGPWIDQGLIGAVVAATDGNIT